jgi:FtsP/CotA-like multicopper oxidase with cupredoxin domain
MKKFFFISSFIGFSILSYAQKTIRYDLFISDTLVNYKNKTVYAQAINGQIPGPTLQFTEGDTAEIHVHNRMHHETSLHWHGIILPNKFDGVPYLTTPPIMGHTTAVYKFPIVQNGTYWYHSHSMLQEQLGLYGAFVIRKRNQKPEKEYTVVLSDWTNENPGQVERSLHYATDWYAIKKKATQNYGQAIKEGHFGTKLENEWKRMMAMDVSDVYYDCFLTNGKHQDKQPQFKAGDTVRLRIVNASSSTYFWLTYSGGKITAVANDGMDVEPVTVDRLIIGVSETYDVEVVIHANGTFEFLATSEDRTGNTSLLLGSGEEKRAEPMPRLKYFEGMKMMNDMMKLNGQMNDMGMNMSLQQMDMNTVMYPEIADSDKTIATLNYTMLRSPVKTTLPDGPVKTMRFNLTGNMNRYVWTIDNKTVSETDKILIRRGDNIRIIIYNNSMMRHPMHLHGHFFRVLNGQDNYSPLKNVLDIMPMETDTIEFHASEAGGDWYFHCHILYHMMAGMGRIFTYQDSPPNPEIPNPKKALRKVYHDDRRYYWGAEIGLESNGSDGEIMLANTRNIIQTEWRVGLTQEAGYESESHIGRFIGRNQFFMPYVGWDFRYRNEAENEKNIFGQVNTKNNRDVFCAGFSYTLPFFIKTDFRIDHTGMLRLQISRDDIPVTSRMRVRAAVNSDREYMIGARYIVTKYISVSTHYDSDMKWGGGLTITY